MATTKCPGTMAQRTDMLSPSEIQELNQRYRANADRLIAQGLEKAEIKSSRVAARAKQSKKKPGDRRGRPPKQIQNPFYGFLGAAAVYDRYPRFTADIMAGIARLDWHDRPIGKGGSSKPLSVRNLMVILETLEIVTSSGVGNLLDIQDRHSQRYVKAVELAMPYLMRSRPPSLKYEMNLPADELANAKYERTLAETDPSIKSQAHMPTPEELLILRHALGDDTFAPGYLINAAYYRETTIDRPAPDIAIAA
ncbi:hypothetical protein K1T36_09890 [Pseudomonas protegens]|uniref:hypothetical protein n=1 Tax=Pseudomonas protegens TaxID=380021 RepID=UPI001C6A4F93|nr:hypothetical protein [Pseudomonas protegens]QYN03454.1 hypothetical protein K1T36_09890 [Pseudomonas protegens]